MDNIFSNANAVSFSIGVVSGIASNLIFQIFWSMYQVHKIRKKQIPIDIEGDWGEYIEHSVTEGGLAHQYSFGKIYRDESRGMYLFDGTNYRNDGSQFCHWQTITSYLDIQQKRYLYIFAAQMDGESDKTYYGFGVISLAQDAQGHLVPIQGHYNSANIDNKTMPHTMLRVSGFGYSGEETGQKIIDFINTRRCPDSPKIINMSRP
ncbi:MAG TPA: hypothetical protein VGC77_12300 [Rhodopseudomonas sp.]|uniref:hypothetical protein n=1 Tax=Rhodopseudomonas sp. TaxID=1078 RepID=UPI002EDA3B58